MPDTQQIAVFNDRDFVASNGHKEKVVTDEYR